MTDYALLILPAANRVYAQASTQLLAAEVEVLVGVSAEPATIGGVPYLQFSAELSPEKLRVLANASSLYALFERRGDLLAPVALESLDRFPSDLLTIQKYSGKTNEQFTRLLLNVTAAAAGGFRPGLRVFDPMCGRGTTLNQAMMYGYDALGMDVDGRDIEAYSHFIQTWLKNNRIKHQAQLADIRRNRAKIGRRLQIGYATDKADYKAGRLSRIDVVNADTTRCAEFFGESVCDLVVADLPYGVQHGSTKADRLARSPIELVEAALPGWLGMLAPGGAIGLSWNTHVAPREELAAVLEKSGLEVLGYPDFRHRVDQSIVRDLIVARRAA
ncbi:MAG TPA: SAM-dependent methyltransferase [Mycobacteriales bacterium]|nr:SAM-dependent methyltransferase [Mycobacteriales bacterium]